MPERIFLDTNVYIVGVADRESIEWKILEWLGFDGSQPPQAEVVVSTEICNLEPAAICSDVDR
ncbi:MAG: hypothetical protein AAGN15_21665 [Cyanobacteria bacterium J06581_3]